VFALDIGGRDGAAPLAHSPSAALFEEPAGALFIPLLFLLFVLS